MLKRHFNKTESLESRLHAFTGGTRAKPLGLAAGAEREELVRKARQADTASHIDGWANSFGLQPPR